MPVRFREPLIAVAAGKLVVTVAPREKCLRLYSLPDWEALQQQLDALPNMRSEIRWLQRMLIGHATDVELDGNGRILLPALLRDHCGLSKELILAGLGSKVEIWAQDAWKAHISDGGDALSAKAKEGDEIAGLSI